MKRPLSLLTAIFLMTFFSNYAPAAANLEEATSELAAQISKNILSSSKNKIAVIEFTNLDGSITALGQFLAEELITKLFTIGGGKFEVVERSQLQKVFSELGFHITGAVDENTIKKLGKVLGVEAIVTGTVTDLENTIKINARMISTETAKVIAVAATDVPKSRTVSKLMETRLERKETIPGPSSYIDSKNKGALSEKDQQKAVPLGKSYLKLEDKGAVIELKSCYISGEKVLCSFMVTNKSKKASFSISNAYMIDNYGNPYTASFAGFIQNKMSSMRLGSDKSGEAIILFPAVPEKASSVKELLFGILHNSDSKFRFYNIALERVEKFPLSGR